jgi:hypothetical protein
LLNCKRGRGKNKIKSEIGGGYPSTPNLIINGQGCIQENINKRSPLKKKLLKINMVGLFLGTVHKQNKRDPWAKERRSQAEE